MISLIRNELKKIFSKKSLYIILIITIGICIVSNIMSKRLEHNNSTYSDREIEMYQQGLNDAKEVGDKEYERACQSYLEARTIASKYSEDSWQRYIIASKLEQIINDMLRTKGTEGYDIYKEEYDKIISNLESDNWRAFAEEEISDINSQLELVEDEESKGNLNDQKQVLEWRLEKNIPYGNDDLNSYFNAWLGAKSDIRHMEDVKNLSYESKKAIEADKATIAICEYAINNNINSNITKGETPQLQYGLSTNANILLLSVFSDYSFFIILTVVIIAGTIVSEEFNKGTIKLLLVRPYQRTKILLSKLLTSIIILVISLVSVALIQTIVGGIVFGFESYGQDIVMYNYSNNSIELVGTIQYLVMSALSILPQYLLLMILAFAISTVLTNTPLAIALPLLGTIGAEMINMFLTNYYEKTKILLYFVTPHWDLSMYAFGKLPTYEGVTLGFSITICAIYFVALLWISILSFKKRDIKNI